MITTHFQNTSTSDFETQTDCSTNDSDMSDEKNVIKNIVSKRITQIELINDFKKIDTQQKSQQLAQMLMSLLLQVLSVEKQSNAQNTE